MSDDFSNVSKKLHQKYEDFFNICNMNCLASHHATDHVIELKPNTELSYMQTYNMFLTELKTLDIYINNTLIKN